MRLRTVLAALTAGLAAATALTAAGPAHAAPATNTAINQREDGRRTGGVGLRSAGKTGSDPGTARRNRKPRIPDRTPCRVAAQQPVREGQNPRASARGASQSRDGRILDRLPVPSSLLVAPAGRATSNQTFEGLTLLPGGRTLLASMEYAIAGDSAGIVRFQTWNRTKGGRFERGAQYAYRTDSGLGVPEVQATPDGRLLVLERGFTAGVGNTVRLYLADPRHATDTSGVGNLTGQDGVRLVKKTLLTDLVTCPSLGATAKQPQPNPLLDNIEGMVITGHAKNRLRVLLVSDDNQNAAQTTRFYDLRVRV
nr:esterase-like activity of phytase family protein [Streptomyces sp. 3214.6]